MFPTELSDDRAIAGPLVVIFHSGIHTHASSSSSGRSPFATFGM